MYFRNDWFMRYIDLLVKIIAHVVFGQEKTAYEILDVEHETEADRLFTRLDVLLEEHKLCKAEDLLFDALDPSDPRYLELALDFYQKLNRLTDDELESANFSREEVLDGLHAAAARFGIENLI